MVHDISKESSPDTGSNDSMEHDESKGQQAADAPPSLEERLADEVRLRQFTERVMDLRQRELETQEVEKKALVNELEIVRKELFETQALLSEAQSQSKSKDKKLLDAKDRIFQIQPSRTDITESEAVETYRTLCGNVQRWVENRMKPILDDLDYGRLRMRTPPPEAVRFTSFMRESARRSMNLDQSDVYHVIAIVMNYLCLAFFSKPFYCPLDDYQNDSTQLFISELEESMSRLPRDVAQCREWRSETLTAITSQQAFKTRRTRYVTLVAGDLASLLAVIVPKTTLGDIQSSLRRTVVAPAAELAHQLHLSPNFFSLKWPARGAWSRLEVYECLNLSSGGVALDLSGTTQASPSRRKVSYLFDVAPGLFVERIEGGKKMPIKAICRPTVLVSSGDNPVVQRPTVLGWLCDASAGQQINRQQSPGGSVTQKRSSSSSSKRR